MWARRFLIFVVVATLLVVAAAFLFFQFGGELLRRHMIPHGAYQPPPPGSDPDYASADNWIARPDMAGRDNPAEWRPAGFPPPTLAPRGVAAFYIHPTTYLQPDHWNAPIDDAQSAATARLFVRSQSSAFNQVAEVWAPRYRQAAFGAFLLESEDAKAALDLAYSDVEAAFERFIAQVPAGQPILLAGHSQGALHLSRLLGRRGAELKDRLVAAYVVGWPLSVTADLAPASLPPCTDPEQAGCVLSWQSFGEPANPSLVLDAWEGTRGPSGIARRREDMLCVNPITGTRGGMAPPQDNPGTLVPTPDLASATFAPGRVGARCDDGFLILSGDVPPLGPFLLPGNNYHVYDYALFWGAIREDSGRRARRWLAR